MNKHLTLFFGILFCTAANSQQRPEVIAYVNQYKDIAMREMMRTGIPASITLAQGILESGCGKSPLSTKANNHFGIKCKTEWTGDKYYMDDDAPNECFRVYTSAELSYIDHSEFLTTRSRYAPLFQFSNTDYKSWAYGLKEAGYATNPKYPLMLINYIETNNLHEYDKLAIANAGKKKEEQKKEKDFVEPAKEPVAKVRESNDAIVIQETLKPEKDKLTDREEFVVNGVRTLKAVGTENPFTIAFNYNIDYKYILTYNDLTPGESFKDGEFIYLENKKHRGSEATYVVKRGESMRDISQKTGVKLRELYARNKMLVTDQPYAGETLELQGRRSTAPRTITYAELLQIQNKMAEEQQALAKAIEQAKPKPTATASSTNTISVAEITEARKIEPEKPVQQHTTPTTTVKAVVTTPHTQPASTTTNNVSVIKKETRHEIVNTTHYKVQPNDTLYSIARRFNTTVDKLKRLNDLASNTVRPGQKLVVSD